MNKEQNCLKSLLKKPIGWLNWSVDSTILLLKIYGYGEEATSCLYFKIPLSSLNRFLNGNIKGCPIFEDLSEGDLSE